MTVNHWIWVIANSETLIVKKKRKNLKKILLVPLVKGNFNEADNLLTSFCLSRIKKQMLSKFLYHLMLFLVDLVEYVKISVSFLEVNIESILHLATTVTFLSALSLPLTLIVVSICKSF